MSEIHFRVLRCKRILDREALCSPDAMRKHRCVYESPARGKLTKSTIPQMEDTS